MPDLLLIDFNMPKMDGLELLRLIRNQPEWKSLKYFIITTSGERTDRKGAEKLGISGFVIKPLKLNSPSNRDVFNLMIDLMNFKSLDDGS